GYWLLSHPGHGPGSSPTAPPPRGRLQSAGPARPPSAPLLVDAAQGTDDERPKTPLDVRALRLQPGRQLQVEAQPISIFVQEESRPRGRQLDNVPVRVVGVDALEIDTVHN